MPGPLAGGQKLGQLDSEVSQADSRPVTSVWNNQRMCSLKGSTVFTPMVPGETRIPPESGSFRVAGQQLSDQGFSLRTSINPQGLERAMRWQHAYGDEFLGAEALESTLRMERLNRG